MGDPAEALASPAPLLSPSSDPLAALAAQLGSQDGVAQLEPEHHEVEPMEEDAAAEPEPVVPEMGAIEQSYRSACEARDVEPLPAHLDVLLTIPEALVKPLDTRRAPSGTAGGATLTFPPAAAALPAHVDALLAVLTQPSSTGTLPLLDHLNLSGTPVPAEALAAALPRSATLGPWWRLRSLDLSGCGLGLEHMRALCSPEAQAFLWHLQRLDLSGNPGIGAAASPTALAAPDLLLGLRLWRAAPLKYLNLIGTDLSAGALAMCLRALRVYDAPSAAGGAGTPAHDGARASLECLIIGPPVGGVWSEALLGELRALTAAAPALAALELHGAGPAERDALAEAWTAAQRSHGREGVQAAVVRDAVVRLGAGPAASAAAPCERAPTGHTLPGPDTPSRDDENAAAPARGGFLAGLPLHILDDWDDGGGATGDELPQRMVQDALRPSVGVGVGVGLPPRQPAPKASREPRRAGGSGGGGGGRSRLRTSAADYAGPRYGGEGEPKPRRPRGTGNPRKGRAPAGEGGGAERPARLYRGGAAEDELAMGGVDIILSDDEGRGPYYSDEEYDDSEIDSEEEERYNRGGGGGTGGEGSDVEMGEGDAGAGEAMVLDDDDEDEDEDDEVEEEGTERRGQQRARQQPAPAAARPESAPERFRCRDGEFAEDDKLGRKYRAEAKALSKAIPDTTDAKAAMTAFRLWDMATNAWDRRRWINPSKDQDDTPALLGQLNRLFDLADKYGKPLQFPFPQRIPGGGLAAFVAPAGDEEQAREVMVVVERPQKKPQKEKKEKERKEEPGPRRRGGSRMVDDGGRGRGSDAEGEEDDEFMVPDGRGETTSEDESEKEEENEKEREPEVEVINLVGTESQSLVVAPGGGGGAVHHRALILDSSSDEEAAAAAEGGNPEAPTRRRSSAGGGDAAEIRRQRELARLSAWHWDSRKEEHPPNADVFGLVAEGKRSRRPRFSASQLVAAAVGGSEEQSAAVSVSVQGAEPDVLPEKRQKIDHAEEESESDDDVPLAAQFGRSVGVGRTSVTPPAPVAPVPALEEEGGGDVPATEAMPAAVTPVGVSSAERAAAAARALLGSLYTSGSGGPQPLQQEASPEAQPQGPSEPPLVGVIPDSQGDDFDIELD